MTKEEANQIIAEFMGARYIDLNIELGYEVDTDKRYRIVYPDELTSDLFSESLDMLVPVWEKLKVQGGWQNDFADNEEKYHFNLAPIEYDKLDHYTSGWVSDLQEAACIATAKAIRDL